MGTKKYSPRRQQAENRALAIPSKTIFWFVLQMMEWFSENGRNFSWRKYDYPLYRVIVTELLLQRTRAGIVDRFIGRFFELYPDWLTIAHGESANLQKALEPFGLWQRRAATLRKLATEIENRGGALPDSREELGTLPGLGPYVVNAILLYRDNRPEPLLDGSMARLLERFFGSRGLVDIRDDPFLNIIARRVLQESDVSPLSLNWGMLDLAAQICTPASPKCEHCPLTKKCPSSTWTR
tara:strand:+ start:13381 stop:14097 length:717 start_codon:yes stop_codon:yes gene_type:complete